MIIRPISAINRPIVCFLLHQYQVLMSHKFHRKLTEGCSDRRHLYHARISAHMIISRASHCLRCSLPSSVGAPFPQDLLAKQLHTRADTSDLHRYLCTHTHGRFQKPPLSALLANPHKWCFTEAAEAARKDGGSRCGSNKKAH